MRKNLSISPSLSLALPAPTTTPTLGTSSASQTVVKNAPKQTEPKRSEQNSIKLESAETQNQFWILEGTARLSLLLLLEESDFVWPENSTLILPNPPHANPPLHCTPPHPAGTSCLCG